MTGARSRDTTPLPGVDHGISGYRAGCGCNVCRVEHNAHRLGQKKAALTLFGDDVAPVTPPPLTVPEWATPFVLAAIAQVVQHGPAQNWWLRGRCRGRFEVSEFYKAADSDRPPQKIRAYCDLCPVRVDCIGEAIRDESTTHRHGWWGSSPTDRHQIGRALTIARRAPQETETA